MRILFYDKGIINLLQKEEKASGGAAVQTYGWARGLQEIGHDVWLMTNPAINGALKEENQGLKLIPLFNENKGIRWIRWFYYRFPDIYSKIKAVQPDYLYQSVPGWGCFLLGLICKQLHIKYLLRISNDYFLDHRIRRNHSFLNRYFLKKGINMTDLILCQNNYQLELIQKHFPEKKTIKISNPVIYTPGKHSKEIREQKKYIAWLGLFQYQKNLKLLYEIAQLLKEEQFHIAGKDSSSIDPTTRYYLKELQQLPNVTFRGFLDRKAVLEFLQNAKFLLNTSHYEGFSNTFLEAMIVGTPILSSHNVNPDGIIENHQLGVIYHDASDLKDKLKKVSPQYYQQMASNVEEYVAENHNHQVLSRKLIDILKTIS